MAGYHTVVLPNTVQLTSGQKFSVVVQLTTPGYNSPIPIESAVANYSSKATSSPGHSYLGPDGATWQDATTYDPTANVCLKAFTAVGGALGDYPLIVNSTNPGSGVAITAAPADNSGSSGGNTSFTLTYLPNTLVILTAPATVASWTGCDSVSGANNINCTVTMNAARLVTANHVPAPKTASSPTPAISSLSPAMVKAG